MLLWHVVQNRLAEKTDDYGIVWKLKFNLLNTGDRYVRGVRPI